MEQQLDTVNTSSSAESPPCKRKKQDKTAPNSSDEHASITTSKAAIINDVILNEQENDLKQHQKPGIQTFKFDLPLRKDSSLAPEETLEPDSFSSKSSRTGGSGTRPLRKSTLLKLSKSHC